MSDWHFRPVKRGEVKRDPQEAEFFTEEGEPDALIREVIQNSLDAAADDTVSIKIAFDEVVEEYASDVRDVYFHRLERHLEAQEFFDDSPLKEDTIPFIRVEDFGTTGLRGDPEVYSDRDAEPHNSFFWFWRNVGRSGKGQSDLGRWGVGKTVFPTSSRIFSYFGLTKRRDDERTLLMGLAVMKTHAVNDTEYNPYGYFATFDEDSFPYPIEEDEAHRLFSRAFNLHRSDESGLSVVIPYPKQEIRPLSLRKAVVKEFFYPVLRGDLEVTVEHRNESHEITGDTIVEEALEIPWNDEDREGRIFDQLDFADAARQAVESPDCTLPTVGENRAPRWNDELFEDIDLEHLQNKWDSGDLVSIRAPVVVKPKRGENVVSSFTMHVQKDDSLASGDSCYVRGGLIIPEAGKGIPSGSRAMAIIEDDDLTALLGDAENPAHRRWNERSEQLKRNYRHGPFTVRFVNQSLNYICETLIPAPEGLDEEFLSDVFFVEEMGDTDEDGKDETDTPTVEVDSRPSPVRLTRREDGFRIGSNPQYEGTVLGATVRAAYDVASGNPFSKYNEWDFDFAGGDIDIDVEGAVIQKADNNAIAFAVTATEFAVVATGFDVNRDIVADVSPKLAEEAESEASV